MTISEKQMRSLLELKEWLSAEIQKHEEELEKLRSNLDTVNSILKETSFSKASSLREEKTTQHGSNHDQFSSNEGQELQVTSSSANEEEQSVVPMKSTKGSLIANAKIFPDRISIVPLEDVLLDVNTQPFNSFFIKRIIGKMEEDDKRAIQEGKIDSYSIISYSIKKRQENPDSNGKGEEIDEITIYNYRNKDRLNEIINTASWSFSKMIENSSGK